MADEKVNIQDTYLNKLRTSKRPARVMLANGTEIRGLITGFDQFTFTLQLKDTEVLIYKSAVAIIDAEVPESPPSNEPGDEQ